MSTSASARLYKCVDDNGKVHYGDRPCVNKKRASLDIVDSGSTSGNRPSRQSSPTAGGAPGSGNADVDSLLRARQDAMNNARTGNMGKIKKAQKDHDWKMQQHRQKAKRLSKASSNMKQKSQLRDMKKAGLHAERKARMDNTLTQCQRFPDLAKCRKMYPQGPAPISKAQRDAQEKVDQWHKKELEKLDNEHIRSTKKDLKAYQ